MSEREPEGVPGDQSEQRPDPVNHQPPEEWRPGDSGDPMEGGPQPPGEPPHGSVHRGPHTDQPFGGGQDAPGQEGPAAGAYAYQGDQAQSPPGRVAPEQGPEGGREEHPTGAPPEPVTGELSEGPSGPGQAGYEHAGYAPGYGESDGHEAGAGSYPPEGPPENFSSGQGPGYAAAGGYPTGQGPGFAPAQAGGYGQGAGGGWNQPPQGYPPQGGYGPPETTAPPWGKILGIGCGVFLLVLLLVGGCTTVALFAAGARDTEPEDSVSREDDGEAAGPRVEVTASSTGFDPGPLYTEGDYTSVDVSVTNTGPEKDVEVNPLYFRIVDTGGTEHSTSEAIGMDAEEIGARTLTPGQSVSGVVTVEGRVEAKTVVFSPFFGEPVTVPVS